jgi:hypothetical protein
VQKVTCCLPAPAIRQPFSHVRQESAVLQKSCETVKAMPLYLSLRLEAVDAHFQTARIATDIFKANARRCHGSVLASYVHEGRDPWTLLSPMRGNTREIVANILQSSPGYYEA